MSVPEDQTNQNLVAIPESTVTSNWTINVSDIRTVKISNISQAASENDIKEFFSFSGEILYVEMRRETDTTQLAYVTFKDNQGADTAILLSGATINNLSVSITPVENYQLPPEAVLPNSEKIPPVGNSPVRKAEDVVSSMLARGYVLGKDALNKAKAFDEQHKLTSNATATVASIDNKMGLSEKLSMGSAVVNEKLKEMDERFQMVEKTKSALSVAEQTASNAGSAIMSNRYVLTGVTWMSSAYNAVSKAAENVTVMTKEKVEKVEEEKKEIPSTEKTTTVNEFPQIPVKDSSTTEPPIVPIDSADSKLGNI